MDSDESEGKDWSDLEREAAEDDDEDEDEGMVFCYQNCSDLLWEKNVLAMEKNFWNSRLKAENLQNFWDH